MVTMNRVVGWIEIIKILTIILSFVLFVPAVVVVAYAGGVTCSTSSSCTGDRRLGTTMRMMMMMRVRVDSSRRYPFSFIDYSTPKMKWIQQTLPNHSSSQRRMIQQSLSSTSIDSTDDNDNLTVSSNESIILHPTTTSTNVKTDVLSYSYRMTQYGYNTAALLMLILPFHIQLIITSTIRTSAAAAAASSPLLLSPSVLSTKWGCAMGFVMAAKLSSILRQAHIEHRLSSDTYKRLNLGLFGFNMMGLMAIPGEVALMQTRFIPQIGIGLCLILLRVWGCVVTWNGWIQNIPNDTTTNVATTMTATTTTTTTTITPTNIFNRIKAPLVVSLIELGRGMKDTLIGLRVRSTKKALTYRNCLLIVICGIVSHFMEGLFNLRYRQAFTRSWLDVTWQWSTVSRLFMIATMIYSLKDAAERDRLTGTTFIELNLLVGSWATLVGLAQTMYPVGFAAYRGVEMYAFAIPFWLKAYKSQKEKKATANLQ